MAKFILVTILADRGPQQQAINIDAITRFMPVQDDPSAPERTRLFLMGPAASEDRFDCLHTFEELQQMIRQALAS